MTGWGLIDLVQVVARGPDDTVVTLIVDAAAQPGLAVTRQRLAAVDASVTVRLGFDGVVIPEERSSARYRSTRPSAGSPPGCGSTGRSRSAWPGGAAGCSAPARSTTR